MKALVEVWGVGILLCLPDLSTNKLKNVTVRTVRVIAHGLKENPDHLPGFESLCRKVTGKMLHLMSQATSTSEAQSLRQQLERIAVRNRMLSLDLATSTESTLEQELADLM